MMAEFCLDCWNRMHHAHWTERDYILSKEYDLCEGCGEVRRVIEGERTFKFFYDITHRKKK